MVYNNVSHVQTSDACFVVAGDIPLHEKRIFLSNGEVLDDFIRGAPVVKLLDGWDGEVSRWDHRVAGLICR